MQDVAGAIEELHAVGATLAFSRGELRREHQQDRGDEGKRDPRPVGREDESRYPEACVGDGGHDLEEKGAKHLLVPEIALQ